MLQSSELRNNGADVQIYTLFGNAALLHIYMFNRDLPRKKPFLQIFTTRIHSILFASQDQTHSSIFASIASSSTSANDYQLLYPELFLWILLMAGLGSIDFDSGQDIGFATLLAEMCILLGIEDMDGLRGFLEGWMWVEMYRSPITVPFWREVTIATVARGVICSFEVRKLMGGARAAIFNAVVG